MSLSLGPQSLISLANMAISLDTGYVQVMKVSSLLLFYLKGIALIIYFLLGYVCVCVDLQVY